MVMTLWKLRTCCKLTTRRLYFCLPLGSFPRRHVVETGQIHESFYCAPNDQTCWDHTSKGYPQQISEGHALLRNSHHGYGLKVLRVDTQSIGLYTQNRIPVAACADG